MKIPLDVKLVSHGKLDRHHSNALKQKDALLMEAWEEYETAKINKVRYTPYQLLKKIQEIVKPKLVVDEDYIDDPDLSPEEDDPIEHAEIIMQ